MKVLLINGSPHENGCTYTALQEMADTFQEEQIQSDVFWIGNKPLYSCMGCGKCAEKGCCIFADRVNEFLEVAGEYYLKPAAAVVSARRAGTTATIDQINKFFLWGHMPIISSRYWNMVHGQTPEQVRSDAEGIRNLKMLAKNMAWFLRCKKAGEAAGVKLPDYTSQSE